MRILFKIFQQYLISFFNDLHKKDRHNVGLKRMGRGGFEPPKQFAADLQSVPFGHSGIHPYLIMTFNNHNKPMNGLEPLTC